MSKSMKHWALLLFAALTLSIGLSSCKEDPDDPVNPDDPDAPVLKIDPTTLEINDLGGELSVAYTIENPVEGADIAVKPGQSWVHDFTVGEKDIKFKVDANAEKQERTAKIAFTYQTASAELTVKQQAFAPNFQIEVQEDKTTTQTVTFNVTPKDKKMSYVVIHITKAFYNKLGSDDAIFAKFLDQFGGSAEFWGETLQEYLEKEGYLFKGDIKDIVYADHEPDTDNYILAFGLNEYDERITDIEKAPYHTKPIEMVNMTFDMNVTLDGLKANVKIVPSMEDQYYYTGVMAKADLDQSGFDINGYVENYMKEKIQAAEMFGGTAESAVKEQCQIGTSEILYEGLIGSTEYVVFAAGFNLQGERITDGATESFTTEEVAGSDNQIAFDITGIGADCATINTTTTNNDPYVIMVHKVSRYDGFTDQDIVDYLVGYQATFELENHTYTGNVSFERKGLSINTDYYALAFGFAGGVATTPLVKVKFTTSASGNPADLKITTSVENVTSGSAYVNITGEPAGVLYYWDICKTAEMNDQEILNQISDAADRQVSLGYAKDRVSYFIQVGKRGTTGYCYEGLEPGTEYVPYAVAIDESNGEFATGLLRGTPFKTVEKGVSEGTVEVQFDKYWDADQVAEIYDSYYDDYVDQNLCIVPMKVIRSENVVESRTIIFEGDYSKENDDFWIQQLYEYKNGNWQTDLEYFVPYDTVCTVGCIGRDDVGNYTHAFAKKITFSKGGASDISGFTPASVPFKAPSRVPMSPIAR